MLPELFRIPFLNLPIYGYGLMLVLGFLGAQGLAKVLARRTGIDPEFFDNATLVALVAGVVGARLSHVLENLDVYTNPARSAWANFVDAINITSGGLTFYGGFLLAFLACGIYAARQQVPLRHLLDIAAPCVLIGLGLGRVGCFLNGCCYGAECSVPWAVRYPYHSVPYTEQFDRGRIQPPRELIAETSRGERLVDPKVAKAAGNAQLIEQMRDQHSLPVHPAQLYSTFTALLLAGVCVAYFTLPHVAGRVMALMLMLEGPSRFILEMLRAEPPVIGRGTEHLAALPPMSLSMVIGLLLCLAGVVLWFALGRRPVYHPGIAGNPGVKTPIPTQTA
ncbi:MAG TPA: prolipoprotein diacylglyceryl transferase [Tepidisphaeraceae bacterium]|nr:prolipoprotein diacylglyceryl transferase [Tepidisphaeraceae bacterium]